MHAKLLQKRYFDHSTFCLLVFLVTLFLLFFFFCYHFSARFEVNVEFCRKTWSNFIPIFLAQFWNWSKSWDMWKVANSLENQEVWFSFQYLASLAKNRTISSPLCNKTKIRASSHSTSSNFAKRYLQEHWIKVHFSFSVPCFRHWRNKKHFSWASISSRYS